MKKTSSQGVELLINIADTLASKFTDFGFYIPKMYESYIEAMRTRTLNEINHRLYCYEKLKERVYLKCKYNLDWNITNRKKISEASRSLYLDNLQKSLDVGLFDDACDKEPRSKIVLDPNEMLFHAWKLTDKIVLNKNCAGFYTAIEAEKCKEAQSIANDIALPKLHKFKSNSTSVLDFMAMSANKFGWNCICLERGSRPRCIVEAKISEKISLYLEWEDSYLLKTTGNMIFRFVLSEPVLEIWDRKDKNVFFSFSLEEIVPGSNLYMKTRGQVDLILLVLTVHVIAMQWMQNRLQ